jgi:hypothetical protein
MRRQLQTQVDALEATQTFPSQEALWRALAQTPWAKERGMTTRGLETKARRLEVVVKTPKGIGHRFGGGAAEPGPQPDQPDGEARGSSSESEKCGAVRKLAPQRLPLPSLRRVVPVRHHRLVDRVEAGSLRAAIDLKCLDCSDYQIAEVRHCTVTACPLHGVRPYQPAKKAAAQA